MANSTYLSQNTSHAGSIFFGSLLCSTCSIFQNKCSQVVQYGLWAASSFHPHVTLFFPETLSYLTSTILSFWSVFCDWLAVPWLYWLACIKYGLLKNAFCRICVATVGKLISSLTKVQCSSILGNWWQPACPGVAWQAKVIIPSNVESDAGLYCKLVSLFFPTKSGKSQGQSCNNS